jgi:hypothetical protein
MLLVAGRRLSFCDRITRRSFLCAGSLSLTGLTLADVLRAESQSKAARPKSVILIFLPGGPSHIDPVDIPHPIGELL